MAGKTTSAGYRIPVTSEYHQKCIAKSMKVIKEAAERTINTDKTFLQGEYRSCNAVAQEKLWKEYVHNEIRTTKDWEKNWAFLLEYDFEGKPQEKKQMPGNLSYYSSRFPVTTSQHVGGWGPPSEAILRVEKTTCHHKAKTDLENYYC